MAEHRIKVEELREKAAMLHAGDRVLLSGTVYTARDAAHKRIVSMLDAGEALPFELRGAVIYYAGPTPAEPGAAAEQGSDAGGAGPLGAAASRSRPCRDDRQGAKERRRRFGDRAQRRGVSVRRGRRGRAGGAKYKKLRGDRVQRSGM